MDEIKDQGMCSATAKPTVVRVKRKRSDNPIDSIWLEVTGRPIKRRELDLQGLSVDDATTQTPDEGASTKLLYRRVETLSPESSLPDLLLKLKEKKRPREKLESRQTRKDKHSQLLAAAKEQHELSSRTARFEQVWRSRNKVGRIADEDQAIRELFHLYDVVRIDTESGTAATAERRKQAKREAELKEGQLLCNYLPLLREVLPSIASEIESAAEFSWTSSAAATTEEYVYDVYALDEEKDSRTNETPYPTIQIFHNEDYDWPEQNNDPDYDSEDSNDENHPDNDYPEDEDELTGARLHSDSSIESEDDIDPYSSGNEEYDTVLSDEERVMWRPRR